MEWILSNIEWLLGGSGIAIPLALIGWWLQKRNHFNPPINPPTPPLVDTSHSPAFQGHTNQQSNTISGDGNIVNQNFTIGITKEDYRQDLEKKEQEIRNLLVDQALSNQQKNELTTELAEVEKRLSDTSASYQAHIKSLDQRIKELQESPNNIPKDLLNKAITALQAGDTEKADAVFAKVEQSAREHIEAAAEAAYQRAEIAQETIQYRLAWQHAQRAAQLMPDKSRYLNLAGFIADILGQYDKAIEYFKLALASDLNTYGEDHPKMAIRRNNLGGAYYSLGQYDKAIEYYQLALASDLNSYGEDHPYVKKVQDNLDSAKSAKSPLDYKKD